MIKQLLTTSYNRLIFLFSLLFAMCYTLEPLYTPNQNVRFIFGIKKAGYGQLAQDWFANTLDPLIPFQYLVYFTFKYLNQNIFYLYHFIFLLIYFFVLLKLVSSLYNINRSHLKLVLFSVFMIFIHSGLLKFGFNSSLGWQLHAGVADQYVLGHYFQTAGFGVLLILSIISFYFKQHVLAIITSTIAAIFHSAYLLSAACLTLSYVIYLVAIDKKILKPFFLATLALVMVSPTVYYLLTTFSATSPEIAAQAFKIINEYRIPHHSNVLIWIFRDMAILKLILMGYALWLIRKQTDIFLILMITFIFSMALTIVQVITNHPQLALIAPWRMTAFIMPISLFIIVGHWFTRLADKHAKWLVKHSKMLLNFALIVILILLTGNAWITKTKFDEKKSRPESAVLSFIKANHKPGEVYMIPQQFYDFRLVTGAPAYIDFKNHPYLDKEVIEWYERHQFANNIYSGPLTNEKIKSLIDNNISHIILQSGQTDYAGIYEDNHFILIALDYSNNEI